MSADTTDIPVNTSLQTDPEIDLDKIINGAESLTEDIIKETKEKAKKNKKKKKKKKKSQQTSIDITSFDSGLQNNKSLNLDSIIVGIEEYLQDNIEGDVPVNINKETSEIDTQMEDRSVDDHAKDESVDIPVKYQNNMKISDNKSSASANNFDKKNTEENLVYVLNSISSNNVTPVIRNTSMQEDHLIDGVSNKPKKSKKHKKKGKTKNKKKTKKPSEKTNTVIKNNEEKKDDIMATTETSNVSSNEYASTPDIKENEESIADPDSLATYSKLTAGTNTDSTMDDKETQQQLEESMEGTKQSDTDAMTDYDISISNKSQEGNINELMEARENVISENDKNEFYKSEIKEVNVAKSKVQDDTVSHSTATMEDIAADTSSEKTRSSKEMEVKHSQQEREEDSDLYGTFQSNSAKIEDMVNEKKEHTASSSLDIDSTLSNIENGSLLALKAHPQESLADDNSNQKELHQKENENKILEEDNLSETNSSKDCNGEDAEKQLNQVIDIQEKPAGESDIPEDIAENSVTESKNVSDENSISSKSHSDNAEVIQSSDSEKEEEVNKIEISKSISEIQEEEKEEEAKEILEMLSDKESPSEKQICNVVVNDSTDIVDSVEGLSLPESKNNSLPQEGHTQPDSSQSHSITNTSLDDLFAETEELLNNLEYVNDSELNQLLGIGKSSNEKIKNSENILKSSDFEQANKQEPVYIYTSLAGGGFHMIPRTNRLATILQANKIEFTYRDLGTDAEARKVWKTFSRGRTLPAVVRGCDTIVGNWEEIDEFNEEYRVRQEIYEAL